MIHVGRIAKQLRESLGLTQQEVARALGITNVHVSNIENEKSFPSQNLIDRYREFFEVDLCGRRNARDDGQCPSVSTA